MTYGNWNAYKEGIPAMVVGFGVFVPVNRHLPPMLGFILGADQKVCDFDCSIKVRLLEKLAYTGHEGSREPVLHTLGRS